MEVSKKVTFGPSEILESSRSPRFNYPCEENTGLSSSYRNEETGEMKVQYGCYSHQTPQEMAGIFTNYPGITEYKRRYKWPDSGLPFEGEINPGMEKMTEVFNLLKAEPVPQISEYNVRYVWP